MVTPSTMIALGLMLTYDEPRMLLADKVLVATPIILLFAYIIIKIPFSYRMIRAGFVGLDGNMEEAKTGYGRKTALYNEESHSSDYYANRIICHCIEL